MLYLEGVRHAGLMPPRLWPRRPVVRPASDATSVGPEHDELGALLAPVVAVAESDAVVPDQEGPGLEPQVGVGVEPRAPEVRNASCPSTVPDGSPVIVATSGLVNTASATQWRMTRSRWCALHASYHSRAHSRGVVVTEHRGHLRSP